MFNRKTLFVVGAGASHEVGLPVGSGLALAISQRLKHFERQDRASERAAVSDPELYVCIRRRGEDMHQYARAASTISGGIHLARSIDDFLDIHRDDPFITHLGKAAIVRTILLAENKSKLQYDQSNVYNTIDFSSVRDTWYAKFMQVLSAGIPRDRVQTIFEKVSFIVFNYDRCLEQFLAHAIRTVYGLGLDEALSIVDEAEIIHPYGVVAPLKILDKKGLKFGDQETDFSECAGNIKTYTEQLGEDAELGSMRRLVQDAECVIFLGFYFHPPNMRLLQPEKTAPKPTYATAYQMSDEDVGVATAQISKLYDQTFGAPFVVRNDLTCVQLFDSYAKSIAG